MGYQIKLREFNADITLPITDLVNIFHNKDGCSVIPYENKKDESMGIKIINETEQGWVGIWAKMINKKEVNIYGRGSSATFYSRNGRWFLQAVEELAINHKGNLLMITREPDTGGGSTTIIYQGEILLGNFSEKLGSPFGHRSIWKSQYDPRKDIDESIDMTIHDVAAGTEEVVRINPA